MSERKYVVDDGFKKKKNSGSDKFEIAVCVFFKKKGGSPFNS